MRPRPLDLKLMHQNCKECTRLWSEYALATRHYLKIEGKMQIADISRDERTVCELQPLVQSAALERAELRRQIDEHEGASQTGASAAGA
jgi:hypothetical protein